MLYKKINGCVGNYRVCQNGNVERFVNNRWEIVNVTWRGKNSYVRLKYINRDHAVETRVALLVAEAFVKKPSRKKLYSVCFKDGNSENCHFENLEWKELDCGKRQIYALLVNGKEVMIAESLNSFLRNANYDTDLLIGLLNGDVKIKGIEVYVGIRQNNTEY